VPRTKAVEKVEDQHKPVQNVLSPYVHTSHHHHHHHQELAVRVC
jgi:hypothetical protein